MSKLYLITFICGLLLLGSNISVADFSDDFEDGIKDTQLWVWGAEKWGWQVHPPGDGNWDYSHEEIMATDGYLQTRVWGPMSGNTYGADAWVRTKHDYNDGQSYTINFTWEADVVDYHVNHYLIQITDGYIPDQDDFHWPSRPAPGTTNLLWGADEHGNPTRGRYLASDLPKSNWSITISPSGVGRLYDGPNASGSLLHEANLDSGSAWYVRLMVSDGTSMGFPAGDARLNLYHFSTEEITAETEWSFAVSEPVTDTATQAGSGLNETDPTRMIQISVGDVEVKFVPLVAGGGSVTITELKCKSVPDDEALIVPDISGIRAITSLDNGEFVATLKIGYTEEVIAEFYGAGYTERDLRIHQLQDLFTIPRWVAEFAVDMMPEATYGPPTLDIGDWGVDTEGNYAWANVDFFSDYAVGVIPNWAVLKLLSASKSNKAGRTVPVKFSLRRAEHVDPSQPFVYTEDLEIRIYYAGNPGTILQTSLFGETSKDYRIDKEGELYITNFKTKEQPAEYVVEIWRTGSPFKVGNFTFETVK